VKPFFFVFEWGAFWRDSSNIFPVIPFRRILLVCTYYEEHLPIPVHHVALNAFLAEETEAIRPVHLCIEEGVCIPMISCHTAIAMYHDPRCWTRPKKSLRQGKGGMGTSESSRSQEVSRRSRSVPSFATEHLLYPDYSAIPSLKMTDDSHRLVRTTFAASIRGGGHRPDSA
jgi:hypothetical protein